MKLRFAGRFSAMLRDSRKKHIWTEAFNNMPTTQGLTAILQDFFAAGTQKTAWYFGLISSSSFSALSADDTLSSHSGWSENTAYSESVRQQWTPLTVNSGIIVNDTPAVFTFAAETTIRGILIASNSTKGGTTGTIWCTALFGSSRTIPANTTLNLYYRLTAAGSTQ